MGYQIGIDVGGAFTDLLVCNDDGRTPYLQVAYYACRSIAGVDDGGMLHVGPASAGANAEVELINLRLSATGATTKPKHRNTNSAAARYHYRITDDYHIAW